MADQMSDVLIADWDRIALETAANRSSDVSRLIMVGEPIVRALTAAQQRIEALQHWNLCAQHQPEVWEAAPGSCPICEGHQLQQRIRELEQDLDHVRRSVMRGESELSSLKETLAGIDKVVGNPYGWDGLPLTERVVLLRKQLDADEARCAAWEREAMQAKETLAERERKLVEMQSRWLKEIGAEFDQEAGCFVFDGRRFDTVPEIETAYRASRPEET